MKYRIDEGSVHDRFRNSRASIQLFGGGYGNGKTAALCIKCITLAMGYPGSNGLIGRATYAKLNGTIKKEFFKWLPPNMIARMPTTTDNTLIMTNGSTVNFRYISQRGKKSFDSSSTSNLLSATFDWAAIDQIEDPEITYKDFLDVLGRMRGSTPYKGSDPTMPYIGPGFLMLATNPTGNWVYTKLVKPIHEFMATGHVSPDLIYDQDLFEETFTVKPLIDLFEAPTSANEKNLPPEFLKKLKNTYKGQMYDRYFMGKWASFEGLVYPEFDRSSHMLPHTRIMAILQDRWRERSKFEAVEGFDFGIGAPSCYVLAFTDDYGRLFIVDGFYEPGLTDKKIYEKITEIRQKYEAYITYREPIWADPAIFKRTQITGETITTLGTLLEDRGLYIKPGQNAIESGIIKVTGYLAMQPDNHLYELDMAGPNLYVSDNLAFIADEFLGYFWQVNTSGERIDTPTDRNDHAMDAIKFMLSRQPDATELVYNQPIPTPEMLKWHERA